MLRGDRRDLSFQGHLVHLPDDRHRKRVRRASSPARRFRAWEDDHLDANRVRRRDHGVASERKRRCYPERAVACRPRLAPSNPDDSPPTPTPPAPPPHWHPTPPPPRTPTPPSEPPRLP